MTEIVRIILLVALFAIPVLLAYRSFLVALSAFFLEDLLAPIGHVNSERNV